MEQLGVLPNQQMHLNAWKCTKHTAYLLHVSLLTWPSWAGVRYSG